MKETPWDILTHLKTRLGQPRQLYFLHKNEKKVPHSRGQDRCHPKHTCTQMHMNVGTEQTQSLRHTERLPLPTLPILIIKCRPFYQKLVS